MTVSFRERHMVDDNRRHDVLERVMSADVSAMHAQYMQDTGTSTEEAAFHAWAFLQFFAIMALHPGVKFGLASEKVRAFWASAMRCEDAYAALCRRSGGFLIEFDPHNFGQVLYGRTWVAYREIFGTEPSPSIWPRPVERDITTCKVSLQDPRRKARSDLVPLLKFGRPELSSYVDLPDDGGFGFPKPLITQTADTGER